MNDFATSVQKTMSIHVAAVCYAAHGGVPGMCSWQFRSDITMSTITALKSFNRICSNWVIEWNSALSSYDLAM